MSSRIQLVIEIHVSGSSVTNEPEGLLGVFCNVTQLLNYVKAFTIV